VAQNHDYISRAVLDCVAVESKRASESATSIPVSQLSTFVFDIESGIVLSNADRACFTTIHSSTFDSLVDSKEIPTQLVSVAAESLNDSKVTTPELPPISRVPLTTISTFAVSLPAFS
jgi:hypothetical protein